MQVSEHHQAFDARDSRRARRCPTRKVRLILAGAISESGAIDPSAKARDRESQPPLPVFFACSAVVAVSSGRPDSQLFLDLLQFVGLGLKIARMRPLELRLKLAPGLPIGVAEMVVDGRIVGLELDRAFEMLARLFEIAER